MPRPIYMDNHATTAVDPRVLEAMLPMFADMYGNAASRDHAFGWQAEEAVEQARERVAALIGAGSTEIVFTSGATESINAVLKGAAAAYSAIGKHVVTAVTEHKAVLDCCDVLEARGFEVTRLGVGRDGRLDLDGLAQAIRDDTILMSIMFANNEIGTIQPIAEIGALAHERGVVFHCDAAQAIGKVPVDVDAMQIDVLSMSGHKLYAPKGVGATYVRRRAPRVRLEPLIHGGGHERGLRSGTLNVPGIVGLGMACELAAGEMGSESERLAALRDRLHDAITNDVSGVQLNGSTVDRLAGNLNLSFEGVDGATLVSRLRGVAVSSGAACASADPTPSHVLQAIGVGDDLARATLRFGLGRYNTEAEVDDVATQVVGTVTEARKQRAVSRTG